MIGWVKIHRKMTEWEWYTDSTVLHLFLHLLLTANHEEKHWKKLTILPGQLVTGRESLSFHTGISEQSIRTALNKLKSTSEIAIEHYNKFSVITITKWQDYQIIDGENEKINQRTNQQSTSELTSNQPANQPQLKKIRSKEDKNNNPPTPLQGEEGLFRKEEVASVQLPDWLPKKAWEDFKQHRKGFKPALTAAAEAINIKTLERLKQEGNDPVAVIEQSIGNGWKGFFPLDRKKNQQQQKPNPNFRAGAKTIIPGGKTIL